MAAPRSQIACEPPRVAHTDATAGRLYFALKRAIDIGAAALLLALLAPLLAVIALAVRLETPGPALFLQERVGSRRRPAPGGHDWELRTFRVYKFRSMYHGADEGPHRAYIGAFVAGRIPAEEAGSGRYKLDHDPRVTRVGAVLRRASLDELPQLLNVLRGEMSLVGPRPVPPYEIAGYQPWHYERLAALPGITGLWQIHGRGRVPFDQMVRMDVDYVRGRSLRMDIGILLGTLPAVIGGSGAR